MWGHVPVKIRSADSSPFSSSCSPDMRPKEGEEEILGSISEDSESEASLINSIGTLQDPEKRDEGSVPVLVNLTDEWADQDKSSII